MSFSSFNAFRHSVSFIGEFNPFTFKPAIDR